MLSEEVAILATSAHTAGSQSIVFPTAFSQPMFSEAEGTWRPQGVPLIGADLSARVGLAPPWKGHAQFLKSAPMGVPLHFSVSNQA
jgi:hypothetical protein